MATAGGLRLIAGADRSDAGGDVEPSIALAAERLQRDRAVGAADQHISARPDPDGGAAGGPDVVAAQRAGRQIGGWREDPPNQYAALRIADIDAKLVDGAGIKLGMARRGRKSAKQRLRGAEDKNPAAGDSAGQPADPPPPLVP